MHACTRIQKTHIQDPHALLAFATLANPLTPHVSAVLFCEKRGTGPGARQAAAVRSIFVFVKRSIRPDPKPMEISGASKVCTRLRASGGYLVQVRQFDTSSSDSPPAMECIGHRET